MEGFFYDLVFVLKVEDLVFLYLGVSCGFGLLLFEGVLCGFEDMLVKDLFIFVLRFI